MLFLPQPVVLDQAQPQQQLRAADTKPGIGQAQEAPLWVPGMQECRRSGAGPLGQNSSRMTGLLGMALAGTSPQLLLEGTLAMLDKLQAPVQGLIHHRAQDPVGQFPQNHTGLLHLGDGMLLLCGETQLPFGCPLQLQEERLVLKEALLQQELHMVMLLTTRGHEMGGSMSKPLCLTEHHHQQVASQLGASAMSRSSRG